MSATVIAFVLCQIIDGDAIRCGRHRVRLLRIDAPQAGKAGVQGATDALRLMIDGDRVTRVVQTRVVSGRLLGMCFAGEGPSLSHRLLEHGLLQRYKGRATRRVTLGNNWRRSASGSGSGNAGRAWRGGNPRR